MPAHVDDRRMEFYYLDIPQDQIVCHFMMQKHEAVFSPPWLVHSGSEVSNYTFFYIPGENVDYNDMDVTKINKLK